MSRRTIAAICAALGLGLVVVGAAANAASAEPAGVHGLKQRIEKVHASATANSTTELQASCHSDELLTGGGYQVGSIGLNDKVYVNAPLGERTWLVEIINDTAFDIDLWTFAVCIGGGN